MITFQAQAECDREGCDRHAQATATRATNQRAAFERLGWERRGSLWLCPAHTDTPHPVRVELCWYCKDEIPEGTGDHLGDGGCGSMWACDACTEGDATPAPEEAER